MFLFKKKKDKNKSSRSSTRSDDTETRSSSKKASRRDKTSLDTIGKSSSSRLPSRVDRIPSSPKYEELSSPSRKKKKKDKKQNHFMEVEEDKTEEPVEHPAAAAIAKLKLKKNDSDSDSDGDSDTDMKPTAPHPFAAALKKKTSSSDDDDDDKMEDKPKEHPMAAALKKRNDDSDSSSSKKSPHPMALNLNAIKKTNSDNGDSGPPVNPMLAALKKTDGVPKLRPVFNANDLSKASLKKTADASAPKEGAMDSVRQQAINDAKKCRVEATKIYDHLRVSGDWVARNKELLKENGVTHILNMAHTVCKNYHEDSNEFEYLALDVIDSANESIICFLLEAIAFIEKAREEDGCCYVHCHMGVSRSCTIAISYVMLKDKLSFKDAFDLVKKKRPVASPNAGFVGQLMEWEKRLTVMPTGPMLYRVAKHSKLDASLVVKLCCKPNSREPIVPHPTELDARGVFLLHDHENKRFYVWCGPRCKDRKAYLAAAKKFGKWYIQLLPSFKKHKLRFVNDDDNKSLGQTNFWRGFGVEKADAEEMDDRDVDQVLDKYDEDYADKEAKKTPRAKPADHHHMSKVDPENLVVQFYQWVDQQDSDLDDDDDDDEEPSIESEWERVKNYDSEDLESKSMYILLVHDKKEAKKLKQGRKTFQQAYIWLGQTLEGRINEDASIEKAKGFINFMQDKTRSKKVETGVERDEKESDEFWEAFESGY